jgi:hypothetical protein
MHPHSPTHIFLPIRMGTLVATLSLLVTLGGCAHQSTPPAAFKSPRIVERDLSGTADSTMQRTTPY